MYRRFFDLDPGPIALTFGLQPALPERIDSIEIPRSRSNSGSDGIFSRDTGRRQLAGSYADAPGLFSLR
jgi:hypothetical protein